MHTPTGCQSPVLHFARIVRRFCTIQLVACSLRGDADRPHPQAVLQEEVDPLGHVVGGVAGEADDQVDQQGNSRVVKHLRRRGQPNGEFLLKWVSRSGNHSLFGGADSVGNGQYLMGGLSMILDGKVASVTGPALEILAR
jgi:hypothetical protein